MVEFTLPKNSRIKKGKKHQPQEKGKIKAARYARENKKVLSR